MKYKQVTTVDIARRTGVSQSAVSMILNRKKNVSFSGETVRRVLDAARDMHYEIKVKRPKGKGPRIIAAIVPTFANPYYTALVQSIKTEAEKESYDLLVCALRDEADTEKGLESLAAIPIRGIIYAFMPYQTEPLRRIAENLPVVIIGDKNESMDIDTIALNSVESGTMLAEHLLSLGHRNIAFISTPLSRNSLPRQRRLEGVSLALNTFGEKCRLVVKAADGSFPAEPHGADAESHLGYELTMELLRERTVSAFIGVNDMVAFGILNALNEKGYRVPGDFSVCGFDNTFPSSFRNISLTSVEHFITGKGKDAFDILLKKINHSLSGIAPNSIYKVEYKPQLVIRGSTGPARPV
ncbi:MAG: LacI family transcriptional regulator [Treponema sp.]|jgi:LacI family transcriptional regulator|nr:LacI family transcriptional regulator [Treponema sp.]